MKVCSLIKYFVDSRLRHAGMTGKYCAHVAQAEEHMHGKHEVTGSIPVVGSGN